MSREEFGFRNVLKTFSSFGIVIGFSCRDVFLLIKLNKAFQGKDME